MTELNIKEFVNCILAEREISFQYETNAGHTITCSVPDYETFNKLVTATQVQRLSVITNVDNLAPFSLQVSNDVTLEQLTKAADKFIITLDELYKLSLSDLLVYPWFSSRTSKETSSKTISIYKYDSLLRETWLTGVPVEAEEQVIAQVPVEDTSSQEVLTDPEAEYQRILAREYSLDAVPADKVDARNKELYTNLRYDGPALIDGRPASQVEVIRWVDKAAKYFPKTRIAVKAIDNA